MSFSPWTASTFVPCCKYCKKLVTSIFSYTTAALLLRVAVAAEFHCTLAGAFRRAISWPLSQATKPSSYFISNVNELYWDGVSTENDVRV